jgi:protein phosphatase
MESRTEDTLPTLSPQARREPEALVHAAGLTHRGRVRGANEDHFLVAELERGVRVRQTSLPTSAAEAERLVRRQIEGTVLMLADGMGGHGDGELAAAITLDSALEHLVYGMPWDAKRGLEPLAGLRAAVSECQTRLREVAARKGASASMGTTLTLAFVRWPEVHIAHVGDSRCYLLRDHALTQVTRDHTLAQQMRDEHGDSEVASRFEHVLVNAIGGNRTAPEVELHRIELEPRDRLLLCTDGLSGELDDGRIARLLDAARTPAEACHRLVSAAVEAGGHDNVTTVVAFF